jgi:nitrogen fixation protein NifU and related proteins
MYSSQILDHFQNPRNPGEVANPHASAQLENPACGDVLKLTARVQGQRIEEIRFLVQGCVPAMACASKLTELVKGRSIAEARLLRREELVQALGGLPQASTHASHLAMDTLDSLIDSLQTQGLGRDTKPKL